MPIHPKTAGASIGGALGTILVNILNSIHGVHLSPSVGGGIAAFLAIALAWLTPSPASAPAPVVAAPAPTPVAVAPVAVAAPAPVQAAPLA